MESFCQGRSNPGIQPDGCAGHFGKKNDMVPFVTQAYRMKMPEAFSHEN
jgi:hypothetical protein